MVKSAGGSGVIVGEHGAVGHGIPYSTFGW